VENAEYSEWVPAGALIKGSFAMVSLIVVIVTISLFVFGEGWRLEDILWVAFTWLILAVLLLVFWNYRGIRIQIKNETLYVDYGRFDKKSFLLDEIASCKKTKASFGRYLGAGVRYGFDGSLSYTISFGDAVEVAPKQGKIFVFSSNNPNKVCESINRQKGF